jgi:DNA sulfur modification protein DndD
MIFDTLTLENFGVYRGEHKVMLTPEPGRPVLLFGGLNGGGKTTLLDAFQLVLFGKLSRNSNRGRLGYQDYLLSCINRAVEPTVGAGLALEFRFRRAGREERYRVSRTWRISGAGLKETVEVELNGVLDANVTERWQEFVEELLPSQIADLFFFDGEKIEQLADLDRSADLLKVGIHALLGLDLVDHLSRSLSVIERRRRTGLGDRQVSGELGSLENEAVVLEGRAEGIALKRAAVRNELDQAERILDELERQFRTQGGELYNQKEVLEARAASAKRNHDGIADQLRELAAADAPLLLISKLLCDAESAVREEQEAREAQTLLKVLEVRDSDVSNLIQRHCASRESVSAIESYLARSRAELATKAGYPIVIGVNPGVFSGLSAEKLTELLGRMRRAVAEFDDATSEITSCESNRLAIPSEEAIGHLLSTLDAERRRVAGLRSRFELLGQERQQLAMDMERLKSKRRILHEAYMSARLADETSERVIRHSQKARDTLERFRSAVASRNLDRLERFIAEAFAQLLRKKTLIRSVRIDPETFALHMHDSHGDEIAPTRLSAGERQLLAVAILWSLARASGRALPTVIDTPLGRLDGTHRRLLVQNYFPAVSHQVILLSTDKEIEGAYYESLSPYVARAYQIVHREEERSSAFLPGYFQCEVAA